MFDARYNIIPIIESYDLVQYILASEPFSYVPIGSSNLVSVGNPLQLSIPVSSNTLRINTGWKNLNPPSYNQCIRTHALNIPFSVPNCNWVHPIWNTSWYCWYHIVNVPKRYNCTHYHKNHSLRHEQAWIHLARHKTDI